MDLLSKICHLCIDVGIWKVKITKVYRGKLQVGEIKEICSFIYGHEFQINLNIGDTFTFAGVDTGKFIQLPGHFGRILSATKYQKEVQVALKLPIIVSYEKESINLFYGVKSYIVDKDICYNT